MCCKGTKMAGVSPTQRSLKIMRERGYHCEIVEKWNSFVKIRQDLFGFIDVLCLGQNEIIGVQTTTSAHMAERIHKIKDHANYQAVVDSGIKILVHGWVKRTNGRWECREELI
jgi:hypothetical protein